MVISFVRECLGRMTLGHGLATYLFLALAGRAVILQPRQFSTDVR